MQLTKSGLNLIHSFEQCELEAYLPTPNDRWTIGWGNTFYEDGTPVKKGDKITQQRADKLFDVIIGRFIEDVKTLVKVPLTPNQFSALVSFAYNVGTLNLKKSTLLRLVNANPNNAAIRAEFLRWNKQKGKVLNGLTRRRQAEADLYFTK